MRILFHLLVLLLSLVALNTHATDDMVIEKTTNLAEGDWVPISTNTLITTALNITNNTSSSSAFYRAVWKP